MGICFFKDSFKSRGECSKYQDNRVQFLNGGDGLLGGSPKPPDGFQSKDIGLELCVDLGLVEVSSSKLLPHNHLKPILEDVDEDFCISSEADKEADPEELVQASVIVEEESVSSEPLLPNPASKKKGKLSDGSSIKHSMKTRNSGIIEEEVLKVMEVGNLLGLDFSGIEQEVSDVIASREAEDIARMENQ